MRATTDKGAVTKWYTMGRWALGDGDIQRTSVGGQGDADGYVAIDTFFAKDHPLASYQLSVTLFGRGATVTRPEARGKRWSKSCAVACEIATKPRDRRTAGVNVSRSMSAERRFGRCSRSNATMS